MLNVMHVWLERAEELVGGLLSWIDEADLRFRFGAHRQLGHLIEWCPDESREIGDPVFAGCDDIFEEPNKRSISHLARVARICPDKIDEIIERLCRFAHHNTKNLAREAAMQELRKIVESCPKWSRYLAAAVLWDTKIAKSSSGMQSWVSWVLFPRSVIKARRFNSSLTSSYQKRTPLRCQNPSSLVKVTQERKQQMLSIRTRTINPQNPKPLQPNSEQETKEINASQLGFVATQVRS